MVFPTILGRGKRLSKDKSASVDLRLTEARPVGSEGTVVLTYLTKENMSRG